MNETQGSPELAPVVLSDLAEDITETVREPLLILDADHRVESANAAFYRAFHLPLGSAEGESVYTLAHGDWNIPSLRRLLEEVLPAEKSALDYEIDHTFRGIGRRRMLVNARVVNRRLQTDPGRGEETGLILLAIEDITDRWQAQVALHDSRQRYRLIVESATSYAIFTTDMRGMVTSWNPGAVNIFGYTEDEILGEDIRVVFTPEDREVGQADIEMRVAEADGRALDERWHVRKNGERFWANGLVMPLRDDSERTCGFLKILRDMSEQRELEESLRKRTRDLERVDASRNEFLAMLAHELRNPLAAIRNAVAVVVHSGTKENVDWGMSVIDRQVRNFTHLIDDLLDVARITQGKIQLKREVLDASPLVHHAAEAVMPLMQERGHDFSVTFNAATLWVYADPTRLEEILVNLLSNAAKYTQIGGQIQLAAGVEGKHVIFRVRDNGVGIAPEILPTVFDLFTQADRSLARSEGGLGIGLTVVRTLTEMHGGRVSALSEGLGKGSEFVVRLPLVEGEGPASVDAASTSEKSSLGRVLVVDDSVDTATGLEMLLKLVGHDTRIAHSGAEAIATARTFRPDVVLLDIGLPGMDGFQVCAAMRREEGVKDAYLVAISGYGDEDARRRSAEAGFDQHMTKPIDFEAIEALLRRAFAGR
jgi:PAS domain S-box-containing protein